jgi:hypothetical protein
MLTIYQNIKICITTYKNSKLAISVKRKKLPLLSIAKILWVHYHILASRVAQSVYCLATGWKTGQLRFDPRQSRQDFSSGLCVENSSGAHQASCTMGTGVLYPGLKRGRGVTLTTHPHLVPRSRMSRSYNFSLPKRLRGV